MNGISERVDLDLFAVRLIAQEQTASNMQDAERPTSDQMSVLSYESRETTIVAEYKQTFLNPNTAKNLLILAFCWATTSFNYYLTDFYIEFFSGNLFVNAIALRVSEIASYVLAFPIVIFVGTRVTFAFSYLIASAAMLCYLLEIPDTQKGFAFCLLVANFGIALTFTPLFMSTNSLFPTQVASTVFSVCNITARVLTIFAPAAAKVHGNFCIWVFFLSTLVCGYISTQLRNAERT